MHLRGKQGDLSAQVADPRDSFGAMLGNPVGGDLAETENPNYKYIVAIITSRGVPCQAGSQTEDVRRSATGASFAQRVWRSHEQAKALPSPIQSCARACYELSTMKVMKRLSISADHPADPLAGSSAGAMSRLGQVREAPSVDKVPESLQGRFGEFASLPPKCKILAAFPTFLPDPPAGCKSAGGEGSGTARQPALPPDSVAHRCF